MKKVITKKTKTPAVKTAGATVTVVTTANATKSELDGLKKAKSLANKAMAKAVTVAKKVVSKKAVKKTVAVKKTEAVIKPVVSENVTVSVKPVSLSKDPGGMSAVTYRESPKTPVFDPLKKPAFIQPITLSGRPLPVKQFQG